MPIFLLACLLTALAGGKDAMVAPLGDFKLESGEVLSDCRVGYRLFGRLNAERSNVIIFPTWFGGTTDDVDAVIGPGKLLDTSKFYVIALDALANGVSSSPANSKTQPRMKFPKVSLRDSVDTQYLLLTRVLRIEHVRAVVGLSMGGMQTFQWMVSYPGFMDRAIPIVGSPRLTAYDLLLWQSQIDAIQADPAWNAGDYAQLPGRRALAEITALALTTPASYNRSTNREQVPGFIASGMKGQRFDANNHIRQAQAMMSLDIAAAYGGSMETAAGRVRAKVLVVVSATDHFINPEPAREFGQLLKGQILQLSGDCGHNAVFCEQAKMVPVVHRFLEQ